MTPVLLLPTDGPDDPPAWCFETNASGDLPSCTYADGHWTRTYDDGPAFSDDSGGGSSGLFGVFFVLVVVLSIAITVWRVSTARRMARDSGMDGGDATAMALLTDQGLEATYVASNVRGRKQDQPAQTSAPAVAAAQRLRELKDLRDQGLITQAEHDERRRAIIDAV